MEVTGMKTRKVTAVSSLAVVVLVGMAFVAYMGGCRPHLFAGDGFCPRFCDRGFPPDFSETGMIDHALSRIDRHIEGLDLSDDQKNTYEELKGQFKENLLQGLERRRELFNHVQNEMAKEQPDVTEVIRSINEGISEFPGFMESNLDLFDTFYSSLNEDQKSVVISRFRQNVDCGRPSE
jgi:hypothetical protein